MTEHDDDFGSLFEASLKAKRFEEGQTIQGTIVSESNAVSRSRRFASSSPGFARSLASRSTRNNSRERRSCI